MKNAGSGDKAAPGGEGFLQKIFSIFAGLGDADVEKKRIIKAIGKDLARSRFKFYKPKGQEAQPGLAKLFFEIYKVVSPAQVLLANAASSGTLRSFVIESYLSPEQRALAERLTEAAILERAKAVDLKTLQEEVKNDLTSYYALFDGERIRQIEAAYNSLLAFINFVAFDYYFLLRKFDSSLPERTFSYKPKFEAINGDYVADDIQDFLEVFLPLELEADWDRIFAALAEYRQVEIVQAEAWRKLLSPLAEVKKSQILDQIVRHVRRDPWLAAQPRFPNERIVEASLQKLKAQVETLIHRVIQERRNAKIDEVARQVFGTSVVLRMKNYTDKANVVFAKKMLGGFTRTAALNYLKAYLMDFFKKDIRELADLFIIRGQWTTSIQAQQLSDAYHALLEVSEQLLQFDDSVGDDGEIGAKLRSTLAKSERDKEQMKFLRTMLKDVNDKALALVTKAAVNLIAVGRYLKALIDDLERPHHEILLNWKEIEGASERPVRGWLVDSYKKIYYMVQLLQFFAKGEDS